MKNPFFKLPDFFKKNALDALNNTTNEFVQIDLALLKEHWKIEEIGCKEGKKNVPDQNAKDLSASELEFDTSFYGLVAERKNQAIERIREVERQFANTEIAEKVTKLKSFARDAKNKFQNIIEGASNDLVVAKGAYQSILNKYNKFLKDNNLTDQPIYPASMIWGYAILTIEVMLETVANFSFFSGVSTNYLIGGARAAFFLSLINVFGLGWLFGKFLIWYKNHIDGFKRFGGWLAYATFFISALILNYFVANYRIISTKASNDELNFSMNLVFENMLSFEHAFELTDIFLFLIGFAAAVIALYTSYKMDDPYPGHGNIHRILSRIRDEFVEQKQETSDKLDGERQEQVDEVHKLVNDLTYQYSRAENLIAEEEGYLKKWDNYCKYTEKACRYCIKVYRQANTKCRSTPPPKYFNTEYSFNEEVKFDNRIKQNKAILKQVSVFVEQIGIHRTEVVGAITQNYETALDKFHVIEDKYRLDK